MNKCQECGHEGEDVHAYTVTKDGVAKVEYQCDDVTGCLERKYAK
jgi:hypothetical protein